MKDQCIETFETLWNSAVTERDWKQLSRVLTALLRYLKQRYGSIESQREELHLKISYLEENIGSMTPNEFLLCGPAIGNARKQVKESAAKLFGGGFKRQPSDADQRTIRSIKAVKLRRTRLVAPDDPDHTNHNGF
jgi:hypothetical protein